MRVDPERSADAARAHLFRYLSDAKQLSRNPIVKHIFEEASRHKGRSQIKSRMVALDRVRELVRCAFEECCAVESSRDAVFVRQHDIFERSVLGTEPAKSVTLNHHISERQFRRDREAITVRTLSRLQRLLNVNRRIAITTSGASYHLAEARLLQNIGAFDEALARADDISRAAPSVGDRVEGMALKARILLDQGRFSDSLRALTQADAYLAGSTANLSSLDQTISRIRIELARVSRALFCEPQSPLPALGRMRAVLERAPASPDRSQLLLDVILVEVEVCGNDGMFEHAKHLLKLARPIVQEFCEIMPAQRLRFECEQIGLAAAVGDSSQLAVEDGIAYAASLGLRKSLIELLCYQAQELYLAGNASDADACFQKYLSLARDYGSPVTLADVMQPAISAYLSESPTVMRVSDATARGLLDEITPLCIPGSRFSGYLESAWAILCCKRNAWTEAAEHAQTSFECATRGGDKRGEAIALRAWAISLFRLGRRGAALDAISGAIDLNHLYGSPRAVADCRSIRARMMEGHRIAI